MVRCARIRFFSNVEDEEVQLDGALFLKPASATNAVKTVTFSEKVDIKESPSSDPSYENRENRPDDENQSAFNEYFEGRSLESLPSSDANYSSDTGTRNFVDNNQEGVPLAEFEKSFYPFNKTEGDAKVDGKKESTSRAMMYGTVLMSTKEQPEPDSSATNNFSPTTVSVTESYYEAREDVKQEADNKQEKETTIVKNAIKSQSDRLYSPREKSSQRDPLTSRKPPVAAVRKRSNSFK
ncbi:hypothetical protein P879_08094 [Paragonimus westermani]|uniref:Uncharacterized protein n=1 Tax=Paragonimus westermani TaxID=34504 RepID=A0A8T0D9V4_9TREM|nr:hypothetical protein P879_08094 [Paragonimus westermani]